jgi:hypothetical protein
MAAATGTDAVDSEDFVRRERGTAAGTGQVKVRLGPPRRIPVEV